jgi:four helix bundle protein
VQAAKPNRDEPEPRFKSLVVWQKAQSLAVTLVALVDGLPRSRSADTLGNQLLRAATSIPANIAEGYGRYSEAAYRSHLSIARGSLFEVQSWLDLLQRTGYTEEPRIQVLLRDSEELARLLTATMKPLRSARQGAIREESGEYEV